MIKPPVYKEGNPGAIEQAKIFERRRCGHHPDEFPEPLSTLDCLRSVVDPKGQNSNKFRYCVASNDLETRAALRQVKGVPLIYISRSVMSKASLYLLTILSRWFGGRSCQAWSTRSRRSCETSPNTLRCDCRNVLLIMYIYSYGANVFQHRE
jgi:hypothetical protein